MLMGEMSIKLKLRFVFRGYFSRNLKFTFLVGVIIHDIHPLRYCYFLVAVNYTIKCNIRGKRRSSYRSLVE